MLDSRVKAPSILPAKAVSIEGPFYSCSQGLALGLINAYLCTDYVLTNFCDNVFWNAEA